MVNIPAYLIKLNARMSLRKNYWKAVLSAFLIYFSVFAFAFFQRRFLTMDLRTIISQIVNSHYTVSPVEILKYFDRYAVSFLPVVVINVLILKPLSLIGYNFFVDNSFENEDKLYMRDFVKEVATHYPVYLKTMALRTVILFFWIMMGVIPVFFKAYSYRMVPYILARYPDMKPLEVLRESERCMKGFRFKCFLIDCSFIGLYVLSMLSLYTLYVFYVGPYYYAVYAEIYDALYIDDQVYVLKYADHEFYHPTKFTLRRRDLIMGAIACLLYIGSDLLLYWGSNGGTKIGLIVQSNWQNIKVMHFAYSIILANIATPFFYNGIRAVVAIVKEKLGGTFSRHGRMSQYFEYSAIFYSITVLLCHVLYCLFPILFKILIMQMSVREAAIIVNHLALYVIVPLELASNLPITIISAVFIYLVLIRTIDLNPLATLSAPAVVYLIADWISGFFSNPHLQDALNCCESFGWLLFMLVFIFYNRKIHLKNLAQSVAEPEIKE
ncbi:MAG: DUF975 family protein [Erysipelotrichaceae bacterium]|nr:DUF975 family protein [Erysipelotrichaceae bacterium]